MCTMQSQLACNRCPISAHLEIPLGGPGVFLCGCRPCRGSLQLLAYMLQLRQLRPEILQLLVLLRDKVHEMSSSSRSC